MDLITVMGSNAVLRHREEWYVYLLVQKYLVEKEFDWLDLKICHENKTLNGNGILEGGKYKVSVSFSPFYQYRYDRIYINNKEIEYNKEIHLYGDKSLCLYHPIIDQSTHVKIALFQMIPWISEWIVFYNQWNRYGVWLGKEIKH